MASTVAYRRVLFGIQNFKLTEPPAGKVKELISELGKFTEVKIKDNLKRIMDEWPYDLRVREYPVTDSGGGVLI